MSTEPKIRRRMPNAQRRVRLLEAASAVMAEAGSQRLVLTAVAARAGVAKSLLYQHFASKQELIAALIDYHGQRAVARVAALEQTGSLERDLHAGITAVIAYAAEEPAAWQILFVERYADPAPQAAQLAFNDLAQKMVATRLQTELPAAPPYVHALLAPLLRSALDGSVAWWHDHPEVDANDLADTIHNVLWSGLATLLHDGAQPRRSNRRS